MSPTVTELLERNRYFNHEGPSTRRKQLINIWKRQLAATHEPFPTFSEMSDAGKSPAKIAIGTSL